MTRHDVPVEYFNGMNEPGATPWKIRPQVLDLVKACIDKGVNRQDGKVRVLDLGSGYGKNAVGLANGRVPGGEQVYDSSNVTVDAVDFSEVAIGRLEDKIRGDSIANLTATNADVRDLDYAAGSYDVVLMYGILEYLSPEEATDLVQKAQEWTAENGINLIVTLGEHDIVTLGEHDYDQNLLMKYQNQENLFQNNMSKVGQWDIMLMNLLKIGMY